MENRKIVHSNFKFVFVSFPGFLINYCLNIILMRYLAPADFGLIVKVLSTLEVIFFLQSMRFDQLFYQRRKSNLEIERFNYLIARFLNVFFSWMLFVILYFLFIYRAIQNENFFLLTSLFFLMQSAKDLGSVLLLEMTLVWKKYFSDFLILGTTVVANLVALCLSIYSWGYWSLVVKFILIATIPYLILAKVHPVSLSLKLRISILRWYYIHGIKLWANNYVQKITNKFDDLMISYGISEFIMGVYDKAFLIVNLPLNIFIDNFLANNYPLFIQNRDQKNNLDKNFKMIIRISILSSVFLSQNMILVLPFLLQFNIIPSNWKLLYPLAICLMFLTVGKTVLKAYYNFFVACERYRELNRIYIFYGVINIIFILIGFFLKGVWGVALGQSFSIIVVLFFFSKIKNIQTGFLKLILLIFLPVQLLLVGNYLFYPFQEFTFQMIYIAVTNLTFIILCLIFDFAGIKQIFKIIRKYLLTNEKKDLSPSKNSR